MDLRLEQEEFGVCSFLKDDHEELQKHEQISTKNKDSISTEFEFLSKLLSQILNIGMPDQDCLCKVKEFKSKNNSLATQMEEYQKEHDILSKQKDKIPELVAEKNDELCTLSQNLEQLKTEIVDLTEDSKQQQRKFKMTVDSAKMAKMYCKNVLGCHLSLLRADVDNLEFLFSFSKTHPLSNSKPTSSIPPNSIKLQLNQKTKTWKVLETNPLLENFKQLAVKLDKSQDIQGFLAYLRPKIKT